MCRKRHLFGSPGFFRSSRKPNKANMHSTIQNHQDTTSIESPEIGTTIEESKTIASWENGNKGFFAKIFLNKSKDPSLPKWRAITDQDYKGPGIIVYINKKLQIGQKLKTTTSVVGNAVQAEII